MAEKASRFDLPRAVALSAVEGAKLPTSHILFRWGVNETTQGPILFDDRSAELCAAAAAQRGSVDYMIDLEHLSISSTHPNYDPDARAWTEIMIGGEGLTLENIRWTDDGRDRVGGKKQKYLSPYVGIEEVPEDEYPPGYVHPEDALPLVRVTEIRNVGLVSMPSMHDIPALAASAKWNKGIVLGSQLNYDVTMTDESQAPEAKPAEVVKAVEASDPGEQFEDVFEDVYEYYYVYEGDEGYDDAMSLPAADAYVTKEEAPKEEAPEEAPKEEAPKEEAPKEEAPEEDTSAELSRGDQDLEARILSVSGAGSIDEAFAQLSAFRAAQAEAATAAQNEQVSKLIELGAETPATAYSDGKLTARLSAQSADELAARVKALAGVARSSALRAPSAGDTAQLSDKEKQVHDSIKDPAKRALFIALRQSRRASEQG